MISLALLLLRLVTGGLLIGHGAQKLFGAFGGKGPTGTAENFKKLGLEPPRTWAQIAGAAEMTGGSLTALGLLSPIGPITATAPMIVAWRKQHGDKPIWVNQGGAELPLTNLTIATALALAGPGAISIDRLLGIKTPWWMSLLVLVGTAAGIAVALGDEIHEAAQAIRREEALTESRMAEEVPAAADRSYVAARTT
jgi:putative oxidoreductase